jgi:hypothetical protein
MYIQIDERIYKWLLSLDVLKPEGRKQKNTSFIELSLSTSLNLESGILFAKLLRNLLAKTQTPSKIQPLPALDTLKEFSTPTSRLYNWNILTEAFKTINIEIKADLKSLIVAGDRGCVVDFLKEIYTKIVKGAAEEKQNQEFEDFVSFLSIYMVRWGF